MALRGSVFKEQVKSQILQLFPNSFINEKEIRIFGEEDGEEVQVKIILTTAKENVEHSGKTNAAVPTPPKVVAPTESKIAEPSAEEMENIKALLNKFNL